MENNIFTVDFLIKIGISLAIVFVGFILGPVFKRWVMRLSKNTTDKGALTFIGSCISTLTKVIAIVIALSQIGVDTNVIVGAFSAAGLGISLALKDNMANVAGGIQVLFTRPFMVGDYIQVEDKEGTVARIEMMFTVLKTSSNQEIVIPNSVMVQDIITNYSKEKYRRILIQFPVSQNSDFDTIKKICMAILDSDKDVEKSMPKDVAIDSIDANSILIGVYCWCGYDVYWDTRHRLYEKIQKKRLEHSIGIPASLIKLDSTL